MVKSNGGIIGPDNVTTGGFSGVASGVFKLGEVTDLIRQSKWPEPSPFINTVPNSARFNVGSSDYLKRSLGTTTSQQKGTFSYWVKRAKIGASQVIYSNEVANDNNRGYIQFESNDAWRSVIVASGSTEIVVKTNRLFRDVSAWYHIVVRIDTTQSTSTNRLRLYVNGVQETSFETYQICDQNATLKIFEGGQTNKNLIGGIYASGSASNYLGGYLSEFVYCDGQTLGPTSFGEFNSDSGIWVPKAITGLTFGNEGFYLKFTNSGALGEDFSGEDNDFTVNNLTSLDQSTDSPSNNFSTLNPLNVNPANTNTFSEGNLKAQLNGEGTTSTMAMASGNWYMEYKCSGNITQWTGVEEIDSLISLQYSSATKSVALYVGGATMYVNGANQGSGGYGSGWSSGDIGMIAFDADNARVYFGKNGGWWNGSSYGASSPSTYVAATTGKTYYFRFVKGGNTTTTYEVNFGNPSFAISSGNADGNSYGNFEYAVPSGYYSLCTKNLSEYG